MAPTISISLAPPDDLLALVGINSAAYSDELGIRFAHKNWRDASARLSFYSGRLAFRFRSPTTQVFKAVDASSKEILGFICWTRESAGEEVTTPMAQVEAQIPETLNREFVLKSGAVIEELMALMRGEERYYISSFAVAPEYQGKGIGSQLLCHCVDIADEAGLVAWLVSFPGCHSLYGRFGFVDVDYRDIDLNAWDGNRLRGYGIHRSYAMRRCRRGGEKGVPDSSG